MAHLIAITMLIVALCHSQPHHYYYHSPLNLYVADSNSSAIFKQQAANNQLIGILFTNRYCEQCHLFEPELQDIISGVYVNQKIRIYRCEVGSNVGLQQQFAIKRFPILHFVVPTRTSFRIYLNSQIVTKGSVSVVVKKLKHYLRLGVDLGTIDQLLVNSQQLAFADEQDVYQVYGLDSLYQQLPLIRFLNDTHFRSTLQHHKVQLFELNSCVLYHLQNNKCYQPKTPQQFTTLLSFLAFQKVNQFTQPIYRHYQQLATYRFVFVAVLDSIFMRERSNQYLGMLNQILNRRELRQKVTIFWMEAQINKQKLEHLGFKRNDHPPLFAYFDLANPKKKVFQKSAQYFTQKQIMLFIKDIIEIDEEQELQKWNQQLLLQSLRRLGLAKKIEYLNEPLKITAREAFVLSIPLLDYQSLDSKEVFYEAILSFNYFFRRVQRFTRLRALERYITFQKISCQGTLDFGFYSFKNNQCKKITDSYVVRAHQLPHTTLEQIRSIYELPEYFWINQNDFAEIYPNYTQESAPPDFSYVQIVA